MSVAKRILEANKFSKYLPTEWEDREYRMKRGEVSAKYRINPVTNIPQILKIDNPEVISLPLVKHQSKKTDINQLSLF